MDPLTQGLLGASLAQTAAARGEMRQATTLGFLSGMAADLDVLIRSPSDPLLFLEYHRQFTHALVFIPVGGLLCALLWWAAVGRRRGQRLARLCWFCTLGYATHGVLDACTTYGTQLLWPFSDARFAWNTLSIVDPLYTLPLLTLVLLGRSRARRRFAGLALVWALAYPGIGWVQRERAEALGGELAASRGHRPVRLEAKPSFANLLVWKVVYESGGRFYVDAVRVGRAGRLYPGSSVKKLNLTEDYPWLDRGSQQARDVERFSWFSNGYVAPDPGRPARVMDIRYSMLPNQIAPLWGIELSPTAASDAHVSYVVQREQAPGRGRALLRMIFD